MILLQSAVTIATIIAITAGIPQLVKLIRLKNSDEFNCGTWIMWFSTQVLMTTYSLSIGDLLLVTINSMWVLFYALMIALILYYRPRPVPVEVPIDDTKP